MRGFIVGIGTILIIAVILVGVMMAFSFFSGGVRSTGLFGWGDVALLSGVEDFVTGVYNAVIIVSSWVSIFVLFGVFFGIQGLFVYAYLKVLMLVLSFRRDFEKILDELLDI